MKKKTSKRLPFNFSDADVVRIRKAIKPFFVGITIEMSKTYRIKGKTIESSVSMPFRPNAECPPDSIHVRAPGKTFNVKHAENCIDYLGFDDGFKAALLSFYGEHKRTDAEHRKDRGLTPRAGAIRGLAKWFRGMTGARLRKILAHDDKSSSRWENTLASCGMTWKDVRIPPNVAARVVVPLFERFRDMPESERDLRREFSRLMGADSM